MTEILIALSIMLAPGAVLCAVWRRRLGLLDGAVVLLLGWLVLAVIVIVVIERIIGDE